MIIREKLGNIYNDEVNGSTVNKREIDWVEMEWFETRKRILHKSSRGGKQIILKFLNESPEINQGDILFENDTELIAVEVLPCDCIVIKTQTIFETASLCYEIGNKHSPLFFEETSFLIPFEKPLFQLLTAQGYDVLRENRKLLHPLKTTVSPHENNDGTSLFSKIMQLTGA